MKIVLGSSSPRRQKILSSLIEEFEIEIPSIQENLLNGESPIHYCTRISMQKAESIFTSYKQYRQFLIISCDTIINLNNCIIGKPACRTDAIRILKSLNNKTHEVISSLTLIYKGKKIIRSTTSEKTKVVFKNLSDSQIDDYLNQIDFIDKAGAYAIQENGDKIIERIEGSYSNVVGFPVRLFFRMLYELNILKDVFGLKQFSY